MKKILILIAISISLSVSSFASPKWLFDLEKEFPSTKFIRTLGEGSSSTASKKSALSQLNEYFNQTITSNTHVSHTMSKSEKSYSEIANFETELSSSSSTQLFAVEYTKTFYHNKEDKYYTCAFINREKAWKILLPKVQSHITTIAQLILNSKEQNDLLSKIVSLNKAKKNYNEFLILYNYLLVIDSAKSEQFLSFINYANKELIALDELKRKCSLYIMSNGDDRNKIKSIIESIFTKSGFIVSKQKTNYIVHINFVKNEHTHNNIYFSNPEIQIKITLGDSTLASYTETCEEISAYNRETLNRLIISNIETMLEENLFKGLLE